jgi:hypothetical protein
VATDVRQALLDSGFDLPQVSSLADKRGTIPKCWEEMAIVTAEVMTNIFVVGQLEVITADFPGDDFLLAQGRRKATMSHRVFIGNRLVMLDD